MVQEILAYLTVALAIIYVIWRLLFKKKSNNKCGGGSDCGCGG